MDSRRMLRNYLEKQHVANQPAIGRTGPGPRMEMRMMEQQQQQQQRQMVRQRLITMRPGMGASHMADGAGATTGGMYPNQPSMTSQSSTAMHPGIAQREYHCLLC